MTWANRITIGRCLLIPIFVGLLIYYDESVRSGLPEERWRYGALAVFFIAAISDAIDGYLARYCNQATKLGAILDPIADKLLLFVALITLSIVRIGNHAPFPHWYPLIVISRDVLLSIGYLVAQMKQIQVEVVPHWTGKLVTTINFLAIGSALLMTPLTWSLCFAGAIFTIISGFIYTRQGIHFLNQSSLSEIEDLSRRKK